MQIHGLVTFYDHNARDLIVQDATGGIYADYSQDLHLKLGSRVLVTGLTAADFTNYITHAFVMELAPLPSQSVPRWFAPKPVTMKRLASGDADCEYVSVTGAVQSASALTQRNTRTIELRLESGGTSIDVSIHDDPRINIESLLDATVRIAGTSIGYFNDRTELVGVQLAAQSERQLQILRRAPVNPYALPLQRLGLILRQRQGLQIGQRAHVEGTVTHVKPGYSITIQEGSNALVIRTRQSDIPHVGARVEAVGFAAFGEYSPILQDANFRIIGAGDPIRPIATAPSAVVNGFLDSKLVSIEAVLLTTAHDASRSTLALASGKTLFSAVLDGPPPPALLRLEPGSLLRVTGTFAVDADGLGKSIRGYRVMLRSPDDVQLIRAPRWWNASRLLFAVGGLLGIVALSFTWVFFLRRRVVSQTAEIRRVIQDDAARDKELASLQEARSRVLEKINSRDTLPSVLRSVLALLGEHEAEPPRYIHLLNESNGLDPVPEACSPFAIRETASAVPLESGEIYAQAARERRTVQLDGPLPARAVPITLAEGDLAGAISVFPKLGGITPSLIERLDLAAQLAALAIDNRRLYERLTHRSLHDALTGLPNRALLDERLTAAMEGAHESGGRLAIAYVDLDKFKQVNDVYGHDTGDRYLQNVARRLRHALRDCDTLARVGGDEFIALLPAVRDKTHALEVARRLTESLSKPLRAGEGLELACSASVGIALFPEDGRTLDQLKHHADASMYEAKRSSREAVSLPGGPSVGDVVSPGELRHALDDQRLVVHYQPMFSADGAITGFEALARLRRPNGGLVSPDRFIDTAETSGIILELGETVLLEAARQAVAWELLTGHAFIMSVNVSARQLIDPRFAPTVLEICERARLRPGLLRLELTESAVVENLAVASDHFHKLRRQGVRIALDDFGTGHANFSALQRLPFDIIKIDRSFVATLGKTASALPLLRATLAFAESLQAQTVAEGIQFATQTDALIKLGCTEFQGYGLAMPMPAASVEARLDQWLAPVESLAARLLPASESTLLERIA